MRFDTNIDVDHAAKILDRLITDVYGQGFLAILNFYLSSACGKNIKDLSFFQRTIREPIETYRCLLNFFNGSQEMIITFFKTIFIKFYPYGEVEEVAAKFVHALRIGDAETIMKIIVGAVKYHESSNNSEVR
ncbi:hypothetical protein [Geoglobus acetivorans]|uniref:Uncharacterized protein n=1 Tax=Geoglobus acetivorans TaxID=565033 RepID=A0ABZ3H3L8_GEOAI|nr:hypothetical protein [Geoglobus acetivorans]